MRHQHRPRHYVSSRALALARPLFRYSESRDAYVLRIVGGRMGPVLKRERRRRRRRRENARVGPERRARTSS